MLKQLMYEISLLEREPQWVPAKWVKVNILASNSHLPYLVPAIHSSVCCRAASSSGQDPG